MKKKSFILYCDYLEHIQKLEDAEAGKLFKAILIYTAEGISQELPKAADMAFSFIKAQIDRDSEEYERKCEKLRENGMKGGRPKQNREENQEVNQETKRFDNVPNETINENDKYTKDENNNELDIDYICLLLNKAKERAHSKGRVRINYGAFVIEELLGEGISSEQIRKVAENLATTGKDVDWFSFRDIVRKTKGDI